MKKTRLVLVILTVVTIVASFAFRSAGVGDIKGWFLAGDYPKGYEIGVEKSSERNGNVGFLRSTKPVTGRHFGNIMQSFVPIDYLGKRVKLTGYIKSADVKYWAGMWFRIDGEKDSDLGFDNMAERPITGTTDWKEYAIVLDVPRNSKYIAFGVLMSGPGTVWLDDLNFQIVSEDVPLTSKPKKPADSPITKPQNTNFEEVKD
jgi:hypothetical protein